MDCAATNFRAQAPFRQLVDFEKNECPGASESFCGFYAINSPAWAENFMMLLLGVG